MKVWYYGKQCIQSKRVLTKNGVDPLLGTVVIGVLSKINISFSRKPKDLRLKHLLFFLHRYLVNSIALMVRIELLRYISRNLHGGLRMVALFHFL